METIYAPFISARARARLRLFATRRMGTRLLFLPEFRGGPVARAINPDQSVKPGYKKGMAPSKRWYFFGMVTPNPHARQNSPSGLKSNCKPDLPLHDSGMAAGAFCDFCAGSGQRRLDLTNPGALF
jgi:hypothetical protein